MRQKTYRQVITQLLAIGEAGMLTNFRHQQSNVQSTQEIVELVLDSNRNELLALDLKVRTHGFLADFVV